ncbi:helix-turn-helix domain-containing protein [Rugosimonospora africana]|uniref:HTH cro/C1-type domain-containing protein n=1 Tax=Rugosimonospora africana TaxID=556532 RepID=A0A8J3QSY6_9ACTN|nr:helix-turn-helix transcriptional regulator [Rugosimonospora africana]GIH15442.1 hypothetical protein Raf01_36140 [Rugosimonospora africana]
MQRGERLARGSERGTALDSPGALLRAWRQHAGWSQGEVAVALHVSSATVSSWETGARRIPLPMLERLDHEYFAGGCLVDLVRALGTPDGYRIDLPSRDAGGVSTQRIPRTYWGHLFSGSAGPVWVWVRPASGARVRGSCYAGAVGVRVDEVAGPPGVFLTGAFMDYEWALHAVLAEPGWVDFGRGVPPEWLGAQIKTFNQFRDLEFINPHPRWLRFCVDSLRLRDHGDPSTLRERLGELIGVSNADRLEASYHRCVGQASPAPATAEPHRDRHVTVSGGPAGPRPPATQDQRRALHKRLREARGLSQSEVAAGLTVLGGTARPVSLHQVHNYESGRSKAHRLPQLPAMLDVLYGGWGWTCFEAVRVRRVAQRVIQATFPSWWRGPVRVSVHPQIPAVAGEGITFSWWPSMSADRELGAEPAAFTVCRVSDEPLRVQVPDGWSVQVHMGYDPDAVDANDDWVPASELAGDQIFDHVLGGWLHLISKTKADLDRALCSPESGTLE